MAGELLSMMGRRTHLTQRSRDSICHSKQQQKTKNIQKMGLIKQHDMCLGINQRLDYQIEKNQNNRQWTGKDAPGWVPQISISIFSYNMLSNMASVVEEYWAREGANNIQKNSPGKKTGLGIHIFLQGIFQIQGLNPGLLDCRQIL